MDPSPFVERDLEHDAEEFIVSWARELPKTHAFEMAIHLASAPLLENSAEVQSAVQHYFATRAEMKLREFRLLMRRGHVSLTIELVFLSVCLIASGLTANLGHTAAQYSRAKDLSLQAGSQCGDHLKSTFTNGGRFERSGRSCSDWLRCTCG